MEKEVRTRNLRKETTEKQSKNEFEFRDLTVKA